MTCPGGTFLVGMFAAPGGGQTITGIKQIDCRPFGMSGNFAQVPVNAGHYAGSTEMDCLGKLVDGFRGYTGNVTDALGFHGAPLLNLGPLNGDFEEGNTMYWTTAGA